MEVRMMSQPIIYKVTSVTECIQKIKDATQNHTEVIIIKTSTLLPQILEVLTETAYMNKKILYFYLTHYDESFTPVIQKVRMLGNLEICSDLNEKMQRTINKKKEIISIQLV